jgi:hypothetical protein
LLNGPLLGLAQLFDTLADPVFGWTSQAASPIHASVLRMPASVIRALGSVWKTWGAVSSFPPQRTQLFAREQVDGRHSDQEMSPDGLVT